MKIINLFFAVVFAHCCFGQQPYNRMSLDGNIGLCNATKPFAEEYSSNYLTFLHLDLGCRMMLTDKFGAKIDVGFDRVKNDEWGNIQGPQDPTGNTEFIDSKPFESHYFRLDLQAVFNVGHIVEFNRLHENLGLLMHVGFGFASLKPQKHSVWFQDWKTQGTDEMMNVIIGITPQYRVHDHWAIHFDLTVVANAWQSKTWDFSENNFEKGLHGRIWDFSVGTSWYFGKDGKGKKHLDWVLPVTSTTAAPNTDGSQKIDTLKTVETTTTTTTTKTETIHTVETIRSQGQNVETNDEAIEDIGPDEDGDGVPDDKDACPSVFGRGDNGCPNFDTDGDGVPDTKDRCPETEGVVENDGCPQLEPEIKAVIEEARTDLHFVHATDQFEEFSIPILDRVAKMMQDNSDFTILEIHVHTDGAGAPELKRRLSVARAEKIVEYLVRKGLDAERFVINGHGGTRPIADNNTPEGRAENERVELKIRY